ncbi:helix-turn-helix domain-containing protein [Nitrobacteraceae bacterium UC4446_H13]
MTRKPKTETNAALRADQLTWLVNLGIARRMTATELARGADLDPSTLTRFKKDPSRLLSTLTLQQLSTRWEFPLTPDLGGLIEAGLAEEATPYKSPSSTSQMVAALNALRFGRNNCDPWTVNSRALEAIGVMPGDIVLVDLSAEPRDGDAVLAQVYDFDRMKAKTVWRRFRQSGDLRLLVSASFEPEAEPPLLVNGRDVAIKGVVLPHRLRPVDNAA